MNTLLLLLLLVLSSAAFGQDEELKKACAKSDLLSCEKLAAYYVKSSNWDNAYLIGDALCKKEHYMGCTFAGTALLAKEKAKEGIAFLTKACDSFEPYACRSLSRLMRKNKEELLGYMYLKRSCHYGLSEVCSAVRKPKTAFSKAALKYFTEVSEDCSETQAQACRDQIKKVETCSAPLTKEDCLLLPGELSIFFRAKLLQSEAKLSLMTVVASEKAFKEKTKTFSYDLSEVLKDHKPQAHYRYVFGFKNACGKKYVKEKTLIDDSYNLYKDSYEHISSRTLSNISAFFSKGTAGDCYDPAFAFEAFAVGNLDPLNPSKLDVWKINRDSDIIHIQDGLPRP